MYIPEKQRKNKVIRHDECMKTFIITSIVQLLLKPKKKVLRKIPFEQNLHKSKQKYICICLNFLAST